jgi:hypothetical protein
MMHTLRHHAPSHMVLKMCELPQVRVGALALGGFLQRCESALNKAIAFLKGYIMKIKTSELTGPALDWAVAKAAGYKPRVYSTQSIRAELPTGGVIAPFMPGFRWDQGGPIIEREGIGLLFDSGSACRKPSWFATPDAQCTQESHEGECFEPAFMVDESAGLSGPTPLIAAMRCFVASRIGDEVDVPANLII